MKLFIITLLLTLSLASLVASQKSSSKMGKEAVEKMLQELCKEILTKEKPRYYYGLQFAKFCESAYEHKIHKLRLRRNTAQQMVDKKEYFLENYNIHMKKLFRNLRSINKNKQISV